MCLQPILIKNKTSYADSRFTSKFVEVPCGYCDECRNSRHSEYLTRVSLELDNTVRNKGLALFLTLTYSQYRIPKMWLPGDHDPLLCFDRQGVRDFLNLFKVYMWRNYGKDSYRYMMVSEFGKETHRPHYHILLLLKHHVVNDYVKVVELVRHLWFDVLKNGFMFPKYSVRSGQYKDSYGCPCDPRVLSSVSLAKYISKYVSKDVTFMNNDKLLKFLNSEIYKNLSNDDKSRLRNSLPRTWTSTNFGFKPLRKDRNSFFRYLKNGIFNSLTKKYEMMPMYIVNKFIYKSLRSDRLDKNNRPIYDRVYNSFYRKYHDSILDDRFQRSYSKLRDFSHLYDISISDYDLVHSAIYYTFYKSMTKQVFMTLYNKYKGSLFNLSFAKAMYFKIHDSFYHRCYHDLNSVDDIKLSYSSSRFDYSTAVDYSDLFCLYSRWKNAQKLKKDFHDLENIQRLRSLKHKFNFNYDFDYDEFP